ncbi:MAG: hypothetical protein ACK56F_00280 [bacterium]
MPTRRAGSSTASTPCRRRQSASSPTWWKRTLFRRTPIRSCAVVFWLRIS